MESSGFKPKLAHCNKAIISHFTAVCLRYKWYCNYTENIFHLRATFEHTVELLSLANVTTGRKENNDNCRCAGVTVVEGNVCSRYCCVSLTLYLPLHTHTLSLSDTHTPLSVQGKYAKAGSKRCLSTSCVRRRAIEAAC